MININGMTKLWIISDTHFGKENSILKRSENFQQEIIDNWRSLVKDNDTIIHLGDVAEDESGLKVMNGLPGKKILVLGNHDTLAPEIYKEYYGFDEVCKEYTLNYLDNISSIVPKKILLTHEPRIFHNYYLNIHGHLHNFATVKSVCKLYLVALEIQGYRPLEFDDIMKDFEEKEKIKLK